MKMEHLARKLASNIALSLGYNAEKEAVIAYGLIAIIQIIITVLLVLFFGILAGAPAETLIICFSVGVLRKYSGGAHAKTAELCTVFSVLFCTSTAVISKMLLAKIYYPVPMALAMAITFGLSFYTVYKRVPVDSLNKPIRTEKKKSRMKKGSLIILVIYLWLSVAFFMFGSTYTICRSYGISLLIGIAWQTFTLTYSGARFIEKMNSVIRVRKEVP
jgi:accessory gene regulator B